MITNALFYFAGIATTFILILISAIISHNKTRKVNQEKLDKLLDKFIKDMEKSLGEKK